jgi:hypothetical protein
MSIGIAVRRSARLRERRFSHNVATKAEPQVAGPISGAAVLGVRVPFPDEGVLRARPDSRLHTGHVSENAYLLRGR